MMNALVKYAKTDIRTANMIAFVVVPFIRLDNIADIDSTETYFSPDNNEFINEVQKSLNKWFLNERLFIAINKLSEKERNIIVKRFGLYGNDEMTLEELGLQLGLTRERVRQIEKRALERLKNHLDNIKDELFECC